MDTHGQRVLPADRRVRENTAVLAAGDHHPHLPVVLVAVLRAQPGPDVTEPHGPEDHLQHGHGRGAKVRQSHPAGAHSRQLPAVQYPAGKRHGQLHIHHPAGRPHVRPGGRHHVHAGHRHLRRDHAAGRVLAPRAGHRRQDHIHHQDGDGSHHAAVMAHQQGAGLGARRGNRQYVQQGTSQGVGQGQFRSLIIV